MKRLKLMFKAVYSLGAIYELRKTPIIITLIVAIILGIIHMSPFTIMFLQEDTYRWDQTQWLLSADDEASLIEGLPNDCRIEEARLSCGTPYEFQVNDHVIVRLNGETEGVVDGLVFMEQQLAFLQGGQPYVIPYHTLEGIDFDELKTMDDGYEILFMSIAEGLRSLLIAPFVAGVYQTGILSYFIYTFVVAAISMLLKFGHSQFISFKEMFNIIIYSSILPIVVLIVVGILITPAFTTVIFNMATPLVAYQVYRRKIIPGLQGIDK